MSVMNLDKTIALAFDKRSDRHKDEYKGQFKNTQLKTTMSWKT
jgi:hypothetical protein